MIKGLLKFFLFAASIFLILALLEASFRFFNPQMDDDFFQKDPILGWKFIPHKTGRMVSPPKIYQEIRINSSGFRDDSFESAKGKKIMVIGDSFVSNVAIPHDKVFTEVMEAELKSVSVMNWGVNGYGQVQQLLLLRHFLDVYKSDAVIIVIYPLNDFIDNSSGAYWALFSAPYARWDSKRNDIEIIYTKPAEGEKQPWLEKSHFYYFVMSRWNLLRFEMGKKFAQTAEFSKESLDADMVEMLYFRKDVPSEIMQSYQITEKLLSMISEECGKRNIPYLFVIAPSRGQVDRSVFDEYVSSNHKDPARYDWLKPNKILMEYARKNKLPMLDLYPRLALEHLQGRRLYDENEEYWTSEGNRVVADEILRFIKRAGFSPTFEFE